MNRTGVWNRIRLGPHEGSTAHDESLRRVAIRLAAQTVGLILVMLLIVEVFAYFFTARSLLDSIDSTLAARAHPDPGQIHAVYGQPFDGEDGGRSFPLPRGGRGSDASVTFLGLDLQPTGPSNNPYAVSVRDPVAARRVLLSGREYCCTTVKSGDRSYRIYSSPARNDGQIFGVVQSFISLDQYNSALEALRTTLLVVTLLGLVISGIISAVLVRRALEPVRLAMQRQRDFVADAAHELRTPLAIMRSVGELGMTEQNPEDQQVTIEQMLAETGHLTRLVDDLSLLARADSNAVTMQQSRVELSSLVSGITEEIRPLAEEQGVALTTRASGEIAVFGDIVRLRQLLLILLDNALKHTPAGGTVNVSLQPRGGRADLQVADTGPGIDPHDLPHIFNRFYRADKARSGEGTGLGLAIARWIVEAHGGSIQAGNAPAGGAVFTVTLPTMRNTAAPPDVTPAQQRAS